MCAHVLLFFSAVTFDPFVVVASIDIGANVKTPVLVLLNFLESLGLWLLNRFFCRCVGLEIVYACCHGFDP